MTNLIIIQYSAVLVRQCRFIGSAFNTFIKQIENRETITLTSKEVRYFMTLNCNLLIKSLEISKGKKLYFRYGFTYNIYNLIKKLISLYGLRIKDEKNYGDIHIQITVCAKRRKTMKNFIQDDFIKSIEKKYMLQMNLH